ncbi:MAG: PEP-CTERM sorting domain-containing protein [Gemmatimonadota bacterium]|nr:PEP-CTERM sorting domain-containing protein [Gemmatimonadota bacterium]
MRKYYWARAVASLAAAIVAAPLSAQVNTGAPGQYVGPLGKDSELGPIPTAFAQTFRAPAGTNSLQSFSFYITNFFGGSGLLLDASVYQFQSDHVTGIALYNRQLTGTNSTLPAGVLTLFGSVSSPLNIPLVSGTTYAMVLSAVNRYSLTPNGSSVLFGGTLDDLYPNGSLFTSFATTSGDLLASGAFVAADAPDAAFTATFGSAALVPEPATIVLFGAGIVLLGAVNFRRKRG